MTNLYACMYPSSGKKDVLKDTVKVMGMALELEMMEEQNHHMY